MEAAAWKEPLGVPGALTRPIMASIYVVNKLHDIREVIATPTLPYVFIFIDIKLTAVSPTQNPELARWLNTNTAIIQTICMDCLDG